MGELLRRLFVDDLRTPPEGWAWEKTSARVLDLLGVHEYLGVPIHAISLDHDLGGEDTTRPIVLWMAEHDWWPETVVIHTANPRDWLEGMVCRYAPAGTLKETW